METTHPFRFLSLLPDGVFTAR